MTDKVINNIEWISLNVIGVSVIGWLETVMGFIPTVVSVLVGLSILALNAIKIYKEIKK